MRTLILATSLFFFASMIIYTQDYVPVEHPNDPYLNPDANACYAGGSLEGQCPMDLNLDGTVDEFENQWSWEFGWYLIRCQVGMIDSNFCASYGEPLATLVPTIVPSVTQTPILYTATPTLTPTITLTPTVTFTATPQTPTLTFTPTSTFTVTPITPTATATPTNTPTAIPPTATVTPTNTPTAVPPTATVTPTNTPTLAPPTATPTPTSTSTASPTPTATPTPL